MQFALCNHKKKEAEPKLKGLCFHCESEVIAKCGAKNVWHWAHAKTKDCDTWSEPETLWHRNWKKLFGTVRSEIRIQNGAVYHIADVVNKEGIIFEFQNSPISAEVIKAREDFYGDKMIWVMNGIRFKDNFQIFDEDYLKNWKVNILGEFSATNYPMIKNSLIIEDWQIKRKEVDEFLKKKGFIYNSNEKIFSLFLAEHKYGNREQFILRLDNELLDLYKSYSGNDVSGKTEFIWEHPRRSWQDARRPVFIDFGEGLLYYITSGVGKRSGTGILVRKSVFLQKYA